MSAAPVDYCHDLDRAALLGSRQNDNYRYEGDIRERDSDLPSPPELKIGIV